MEPDDLLIQNHIARVRERQLAGGEIFVSLPPSFPLTNLTLGTQLPLLGSSKLGAYSTEGQLQSTKDSDATGVTTVFLPRE